jgi:TM2 domain-containing membrane protein YozV
MWADPECKTKRKSQIVAFLLSLFTGFLGFDEFYLGNIALGFVKLFTFGGCGLLWIADIIRIGSAPVYASEFRVGADLPHFAYVLSVTMYALCCGFALAYVWTTKHRGQKRKEAMILTLDEEARQKDAIKPFADAYGSYSAGRDVQRPILQNPRGMGSMPPMGMGGMA